MAEPGTQLGPYTILGRLGAGGMGEVHLARDNRLNREVALKTLPPDLAGDAEKLARFRQEALTLAALNHPNIATIYGFEEPVPGTLLLVLERVEGETLGDRLARAPLAIEEALPICAQIAEALEVAHERGVIHRDLKPGNVMIGPRGLVKVLDFGLARSVAALTGGQTADKIAEGDTRPVASAPPDGNGSRIADAATIDMPTLDLAGDTLDAGATSGGERGRITGTPGYMSPEQVRAEHEDPRTDVFAFGCVLYEALTARRAFPGEDAIEVLRAILSREPDWSLIPAKTPGRVRELLERCLEKDPTRRLAEMRAARFEIEEALGVRRAAALRAGEAMATPHNLPKSLTSFVGREREIEICTRLLEESRLITLIGVGGSGKTRLAVRVASDLLDHFPDGVWFVDLAPVADPDRVPLVLTAALGLREEPGKTLVQTLIDHLANRKSLVLLDNCEHLVEASAIMAAALLESCPELRLMATSREALNVAGETLHAVPTLKLPGARAKLDAKAAAGYESVQLFVERAQLGAPRFELTDGNAGTVGEICRRLDGIPLAIELAAARVKVLGVEEIRTKLDDRFRLLTGGSRASLPRHQTLRATIQWSYDQLAAPEQELLRALSVFAGGWTLDSATAVCAENADEFEILDLLSRLVDKSLAVVEPVEADASRYRFLETVRQYSLERLAETAEGPPLRDRHLDYFLGLSERAEHKLTGPEQGVWLGRLDVENENLLAALNWCAQAENGAAKGLRMAGALARFWSSRGYYELGLRMSEEALRRPGAETTNEARAKALVRAGGLALYRGDYSAARPWIEESLAIYRERQDRKGIARTLGALGTVATFQGDLDSARRFGEEGLAIYEELGESRGMAIGLHHLAYVALRQGDLPSADQLYERSLALYREVGDLEYVALTLADLGVVSMRLGRIEGARAQLSAGLRIAKELGARREAAYGLEGTAELAEKLGSPEQAARLWGAAETVREAMGSPLVPAEHEELQARITVLREQLGEETFEAARLAGKALELQHALDEALGWLEKTPDSKVRSEPAS